MTRRSILLDHETADDFDAALKGPVRPYVQSARRPDPPLAVQFLIVMGFACAAALVTFQIIAWL